MVRLVEGCRRRGLKVNAGKRKVMVKNGEDRLEREVHVDRVRLKHVSEFKYLGCVLTNRVQMGQNAVGRERVGRGRQVPLGP